MDLRLHASHFEPMNHLKPNLNESRVKGAVRALEHPFDGRPLSPGAERGGVDGDGLQCSYYVRQVRAQGAWIQVEAIEDGVGG